MAGVTFRTATAQLNMAVTGSILPKITGTLFYLTIVASHFLSDRLTHDTSGVQQTTCLLEVMRVWESKENICGWMRYVEQNCVNPDWRKTGIAASTKLRAVVRNGPSDAVTRFVR